MLPGADADLTLALTVQKDIVTTAPLTGGENNVLTGADADLTLALTLQKDLVGGNGITGGGDNTLPGADADVSYAVDLLDSQETGGTTTANNSGLEFEGASDDELTLLQGCADGEILQWAESTDQWACDADDGGTVLKDLVTTAPLAGGTNDILPGADADVTLSVTVNKDLVTTAPLTGGTDDIMASSALAETRRDER